LICLLLSSVLALQQERIHKKRAIHHRRVNGGASEPADEELAKAIKDNMWDEIRKLGKELGKMFEITESTVEAVEKVDEKQEQIATLTSAIDAAKQLYAVTATDGPEDKLKFLKSFVELSADLVELPGVHQMLQVTAAAIGSILESFESWKKSVQADDRQGNLIEHTGFFGDDLVTPLAEACELEYGPGGSVPQSGDEHANSLIILSRSAKNWFIDHAPLLEKLTQTKLVKFRDDAWTVTKRINPSHAVDETVMKDWIRKYWPIASYLAFGETTASQRFCMCSNDKVPATDCHTF